MRSRTQQPKRDDVGVAAYLHDGAFKNGISGPLQTGRQVRVHARYRPGRRNFSIVYWRGCPAPRRHPLARSLDRDFSLDRSLEGGDEIEVAEEGVVYEIDENMLRRELQRLTEEAADEADQFGGGEVPHGDVFVDVDEDDLINALADELGDVAPAAAAPAVAESRLNRSASRKLREARRIMAKQDSTIEALKAQLVEMNLFNAKLLYANKLMQNRNLSLKNQKTIVEALDSASTIREAKLLYKSLSSSLERKVSSRGGLNEGSLRKLGSASRSTRSAQPKTEANREADRWAVLAGI